jgi:transketolase
VLSNGHASMLLYSVLHLTGYPLVDGRIQEFPPIRLQNPGHPEREVHLGIETTTGPLGQGFANAVGMALAERALAATFNRPGHNIVDHHTYVFVGDGCMMEGISHEVASFAGVQKLGKLIWSTTTTAFRSTARWWAGSPTTPPKRFEAYGWHVQPHVDGHDSDAVAAALGAARAETDRPSLICAKTIIGWGAPNKQGTAAMHGEAHGRTRRSPRRGEPRLDSPPFEIPADIRAAWDMREKGAGRAGVAHAVRRLQGEFPALAAEFERRMDQAIARGIRRPRANAYRQDAGRGQGARDPPILASGAERVRPSMPELLGGSADLTPSNGTLRKDSVACSRPDSRRQLRAFRRARIRHVGDHERHRVPWRLHSLRRHLPDLLGLRAQRGAHGRLMRLRVIFVYTHDSIGLGEDGPTHQPIEHLASLRDHSAHGRVAALRCGRDRDRLGRGARESRRPDVPDFHAPSRGASGAQRGAGGGDRGAAATC